MPSNKSSSSGGASLLFTLLISHTTCSFIRGFPISPLVSSIRRLSHVTAVTRRRPYPLCLRAVSNLNTNTFTFTTSTTRSSLYDILNVSSNATKAEIKRAYIQLARQTHPDALIQAPAISNTNINNTTDNSPVASSLEFAEISQAYKILIDPLQRLRYDRSIRAEAISRDWETVLDQFTASAGPPVLRALDQFAIPFLRRSAASAVAVVSSVLLDPNENDNNTSFLNHTSSSSLPTSSANNKKEFSQVIAKAIRAGQRASQAIDRMELMDKSREIQQRVETEKILLSEKQQELTHTISQRMYLTLNTPMSHLTSMDACTILDGFKESSSFIGNMNESSIHSTMTFQNQQQHFPFSFLDSMLHKRSIENHIEQLKLMEDEYDGKQTLMNQLQQTMDNKTLEIQMAQDHLVLAIQAEEAARKALEEAMIQVSTAKAKVGHVTKSISTSEETYRRIVGEVDKVKSTLERKQERVRVELQRKQEQHVVDDVSSQNEGDILVSMNDSERIHRDQTLILELRQKELDLEAEMERLALNIRRMNSRAQKLMERSSSTKF